MDIIGQYSTTVI